MPRAALRLPLPGDDKRILARRAAGCDDGPCYLISGWHHVGLPKGPGSFIAVGQSREETRAVPGANGVQEVVAISYPGGHSESNIHPKFRSVGGGLPRYLHHARQASVSTLTWIFLEFFGGETFGAGCGVAR